MFYNEHGPPHFHAKYGEYEMSVRIDTLSVTTGRLPRRAQGLVIEWARQHQQELMTNWQLARRPTALRQIEGLE